MRRYLWPAVGFGLAAALPFVITGSYRHNIMALMLVYAIAAVGLNLLVGIAGQISMGHGAFMLIGGYTSAILTLKAGLPLWLSIPAAGVAAALVGFVLGLPALRLHGHFLALATLSFGVAIPQIAMKWGSVTGGAMGLSPKGFASDRIAYWTVLGVLALLVWVADNLLRSRPGRALRAVRDSEVVALSMGISLVWAKTSIFALSAFFAGVAGALGTHLAGFINPTDYNMLISFQLLATVVVGGLGSIPGSIAGAVLVTFLPFAFSRSKGWASTIEGLAIIGIVIFLPYGLASLVQKLRGVRRRAAS